MNTSSLLSTIMALASLCMLTTAQVIVNPCPTGCVIVHVSKANSPSLPSKFFSGSIESLIIVVTKKKQNNCVKAKEVTQSCGA